MLAAKALKGCYKNENGVYLWIANVRVIWNHRLFAKWNRKEPNNHGGHEKCINIFPQHDYRWNDEPCPTKLCFLCK